MSHAAVGHNITISVIMALLFGVVCNRITWFVTDIWWKCHVNSTFRNIFTEKNGDMFNTYFTRCIYIYIINPL